MITEQQALDDLIVTAAQENNDAAVIKLLSEIKTSFLFLPILLRLFCFLLTPLILLSLCKIRKQ